MDIVKKVMIPAKEAEEFESSVGFSCNRCGKEFYFDASDINMQIDIQNTLRVSKRMGYGSLFGDGLRVRIDLCEECLLVAMGKWVEVFEEDQDGNWVPCDTSEFKEMAEIIKRGEENNGQ